MSADKRNVSTDALETLGMIHTDEQYRDAIHLGVEPVIAGQKLKAGDHIGIKNGMAFKKADTLLGIVDPFLTEDVQKGEKFWLIVYPRQITSLRHVWSHLLFDNVEDVVPQVVKKVIPVDTVPVDTAKELAYKWIQAYAESFGNYDDSYCGNNYSTDADELIDYGKDFIRDSRKGKWPDYLVKGGLLEDENTSAEFWTQLSIYLEEEIEQEHRGNFFSCSC